MRWVGRKLLLIAKLLGPQCSRSVPVDSAMQHTVGRSSGQQRGQISVDSVGQISVGGSLRFPPGSLPSLPLPTHPYQLISALTSGALYVMNPTWLPTFPPTTHPSLPTYISSLRYESLKHFPHIGFGCQTW